MLRIWPCVAVVIVGCVPSEPPAAQRDAVEQMGGSEPARPESEGARVGVASPALGGASPVTGADNVGGGGMGGVGQAAKDAARGAALKAGGSSLGRTEGEGQESRQDGADEGS